MTVIQVAFDVPDYIVKGLADGSLQRYGGVIRDVGGEVVKHLDEVALPAQAEAGGAMKLAKGAVDVVKANKVAAVAVGVACVAAAGGVVIYKTLSSKKHKELESGGFNKALKAYSKAVQKGKMTQAKIEGLIGEVDLLLQAAEDDSIVIPENQLQALGDMTYGYSMALAQANNVEATSLVPVRTDSSKETLYAMRGYLLQQKKIFEDLS